MQPRPIHEIEAKWQKIWEEEGTYKARQPEGTRSLSSSDSVRDDENKAEKFYGLIEFPYPSGDGLHVGHTRSHAAIDAVTRKKRMEGKNVMYPIGWDAFGLPTENYAIKNKIRPQDATKKNIGNFTRQIKSLGLGFDWSREIDTTDPAYYEWTQWQFLQFFKYGMAYKATSTINWCPKDKIGLANEEAQGGVCERCGTAVEKREKEQWMIRITDYAQRLLTDLDTVDYLDKVKTQQINWIGKSEGAEIVFRIPKFARLLVATNNKSKLERVKTLLQAVLPGVVVVSPEEAGLEAQDVQEGSDMIANARAKAMAYAGKTDLPVLGTDTGLFIAGEKLDPAAPKRNALGGHDESVMTLEEKAEAMDAFYREIAEKHGGEVQGYWHDVTVLRMPDGEEIVAQNKRSIILTNQRKGEMDLYFPVRGLYKVAANKKYVVDQTEDELVYVELGPFTRVLVDLCSYPLKVFTTRPDTIFGVTYVVLAPEHELVKRMIERSRGVVSSELAPDWSKVEKYIEEVGKKTEEERLEGKEKTGVQLPGVFAVNPVNGERVPVWISDYVLAGYGTGAVMAVPAHDERDFAFAEKFGLPVRHVVAPLVTVEGAYAPQESKETTRKRVVTAIIYRPRTQEYLLLEVADGRKMFVGGGLEPHEHLEDAVLREIYEETGYAGAEIKRVVVPVLYGEGYKPSKGVNCFDLDTAFYVELNDETQKERAEGDKEAHHLVWKKAQEVASFLNLEHHQEMWRWFQEHRPLCFTEAGLAVQSGFLNELPTWKAKEDCISWLEEHGVGTRTSTYKLRDWVFSRQRYWGEPIPLVHCAACAKKKQKALIIHGLGASAESNWYAELKLALEEEGFEVFLPSMSQPLAPTYEGWMTELTPYLDQLGEDDVIVGHSLGGLMAVHAVAKMGRKIGHVYLVAPLLGPISDEQWMKKQVDRPDRDFSLVRKIWERPIDWDHVSSLIGSAHVLVSDNDTRVPKQSHQFLPQGWYIKSLGPQGHFFSAHHPEVVREVLTSKISGWIPVPDDQLPLTLPAVEAYEPTDTGESPLAKIHEWVQTTCPRCGGPATRETDTMPNWAGSSWYFLRYCDPHNDQALASSEALKYWMPVDLYNGGMEHTTLHLLYSRFWHKFLWDVGIVPEECGSEPYAMRRSHNMILGEGGVKMSKSKGNVVNPDDVVATYGADVFRLYEMFIGPYDQPAPWDTAGIEGVRRFLDKVWGVFSIENRTLRIENSVSSSLETLYHQTVKKVSEGIDNLQFNTCVSQLMILTNAFQEAGTVPEAMVEGYLKLLAPFAPHLTEELWRIVLGKTSSIHARGAGWPIYDVSKLQAATFELVVQVNGKVREKMTVASDIEEEEVKKLVLASEKVQKWLEGKMPSQLRYIKGRLVNIVV